MRFLPNLQEGIGRMLILAQRGIMVIQGMPLTLVIVGRTIPGRQEDVGLKCIFKKAVNACPNLMLELAPHHAMYGLITYPGIRLRPPPRLCINSRSNQSNISPLRPNSPKRSFPKFFEPTISSKPAQRSEFQHQTARASTAVLRRLCRTRRLPAELSLRLLARDARV